MPETALINNWLFAAMSDEDQDALRPAMVRRVLAHREILLHAGREVETIHFPVSAQIANVMRLGTGKSVAVSTVGRDGVTGLAAFMALQPSGWDAVAHVPGVVWSAPAQKLRELAAQSRHLNAILLQATHEDQLKAHAQIVCTTFHAITARLARWILQLQERTGLSRYTLTQSEVAELFGVQRTSIVSAFKTLSDAGALAPNKRGRLVILDRHALRGFACSCHGRLSSGRPPEGDSASQPEESNPPGFGPAV